MPDSSLSALTASTPATAGLLYTVQGGADHKLSMTAAGAAMIEAANPTAQADLLTALLAKAGGTMTGALAITAGSLNTTSLSASQTWNNNGTVCRGLDVVVTDTNSAAGSTALRILGGSAGTSHLLSVNKDGLLTVANKITAQPNTNLEIFNSGAFNRVIIGSQDDPSNGISVFGRVIGVPMDATIAFSSNVYSEGTPDVRLSRAGAASLRMGLLHATTPTDQTLTAHDVTTGTGAALTLQGGAGSVARGNVVLNGGNRAPYDAAPIATTIRDILISHGLMAPS